MNFRITLGFLVAALILGVLVVGLDKFNIGPTSANQANATATTTAVQQPQVFSFDDSKVTAFEIHQGTDTTVRIEKNSDGNWLVAGSGDPANKSSFTSLIIRMSQLKATQVVGNAVTDLSQYGLAPPKDAAIAQLDDGTKFELDLGTKTPVQTGTYAKKGDDPTVYVVADQFTSDIERLVSDPKEPPTPTPQPPTSVPVTTPSPATTGTPTPAG